MIGRVISLFVDLFLISSLLWLLGFFIEDLILLTPLLVWSYFSFCYIAFAQTAGYKLLGYKVVVVVSASSVLSYALRLILRAGIKTLCLGVFVPLIPLFGKEPEKRSLLDLVCGTLVVAEIGKTYS
jgi:uncharacterized RDD family membrane protein YckC